MTAAPLLDRLLADLTPAQHRAVTIDAAPLCIVAAAGAGKTRVLTRRIAYRCVSGTADAGHTLALTFTRKAAGELRARLSSLGLDGGVAAGTFHSTAVAQLQRWWADRRSLRPTMLDRKSRVLGPLMTERPALEGAAVADVARAIEWAKARAVSPEEFVDAVASRPAVLAAGLDPEAVAAVYGRYEHEKRRRGLVDFDDLLGRCADAIESDPGFAAAQRWRWRHIYVDEFQDLNPLQHRLLAAWLGSSTDLCVVGDPHQAIYGWNGADPAFMADLPRLWPSTEVVRLDDNHRCTEQIVAAAAAVLGPGGRHLRAAGRQGPAPTVTRYPSEQAEARGIAAHLAGAHREGAAWSSMAVLARTNAQLAALSEVLSAAGVPWRSVMPAESDDDRSRAPAGDPSGVNRAGSPTAAGHAGAEDGADAVTLSSFHRSKGLEWSHVWVAGVEEGLVPLGRPDERMEVEERQLLYVALTRAVDRLAISWAAARSFGGRHLPRQPSRWLDDVEDTLGSVAGDGHIPVREWRRRLAEQRTALRSGRSPQPGGRRSADDAPEWCRDARARLRAWRVETARATGVPPHMVLHDATLEAIAARNPSTLEELVTVPGFGPVRASRYGLPILEALAQRAATG